ncbi:hypothetical protein ACSBR2_032518 [Camellia fascicularis]
MSSSSSLFEYSSYSLSLSSRHRDTVLVSLLPCGWANPRQTVKMQKILGTASARAVSGREAMLKRHDRLLQSLSNSNPRLAHSSSTALPLEENNDALIPKMPQFDYTPPPYTGPPSSEILKKRLRYLSPSFFHLYTHPLNLVDGKMQYLFDENGRRYLDAFGGIATVCCGHCHPDVVEAIVNQTNRLQHSTILYLNAAVAEFAEALASKMPGDLKVVFFTNSGTEANELALMMARLYSGSHDIVSIRNGYHGNAAATMGATAQCNYKFNVVQGVGGILELAPGYLPSVYSSIRKAGGLCIADEVQSGFGRTGSHFWGFEAHRVVPDIVTMAKGIGNGLPLGAVVTTPEIAKVLTYRCYFNTFGGNPVSTAGGLAVLRVLEKEKLQENAFAVGSYLKERLTSLKEKHEIIGDVRGRGLMLGVELVTDRELKTPAKAETVHIMEQMKEMGVLIGKGGFRGNVFRITPPLCFTKEDADFLVGVMDYAMLKL